MKNFFLLFISILSINIFAQQTGVSVPENDTTKIPNEWKNESLIILKYSIDYDLNLSDKSYERVKIVYYLRDKWALDELSRIDLPEEVEGIYGGRSIIGVIHKKDGSIKEIGDEHLIPKKVSMDFNSTSKKNNVFSLEISDGKKLAVPSIEVGDILEINYKMEVKNFPNVIPLINTFSIVDYDISLKINKSYNYSYYGTAYNSGYSYSVNASIKNSSINFVTNNSDYFSIEANNVKRYKEEILNDNLTQIPYVLVTYSNYANSSSQTDFKSMTGSQLEANQKKQIDWIFDTKRGNPKSAANLIYSKLKVLHPKITDTVQYVTDAYYLYREYFSGDYGYIGYNRLGYKNDYFFVNVMNRVFLKSNIKCKTFMSQESHFGGVSKESDFLEPVYGVEIPTCKKYLFNPMYSFEPNNIPSYFENQNYISFTANQYYNKPKFRWWPIIISGYAAYIYAERASNGTNADGSEILRNGFLIASSGIAFSSVIYFGKMSKCKKYRHFGYEEKTFPFKKAENNKIVNELTVEDINPVNNEINISTNDSYFGKMRLDELKRLNNYTYLYAESQNKYAKLLFPAKKLDKEFEDEKEQISKNLKKLFKRDLQDDDFDVVKVNNFKIEMADFTDESKPVVYTIDFKAKNLVVKSGDYMIVHAGKLLGSQLQVGESSTERTQDFYIPFQKQFEKRIKIKIPAGYSVVNLNDFAVSHKTSAGEFVTTATIESGYVVIKSKKAYSFQTYYKEDAEDIYSFLKIAEEFTAKKLILKKN